MVKILIGNIASKIVGYLPDNVQTQLDKVLSYTIKDAHYLISVRKKKWDGVYHLYKRHSGQSFYTGLLSLAEDVLKANNVAFLRVDERIKPPQNLPDLKFVPQPYFEERDYQKFTIDRAIQKTRGILKICTGGGKCLGKGTKILMFNGTIKAVEDIIPGDLLMGPDSKPRKVKNTTVGYGDLFLVKQNSGDDFICNDEHILCLQTTSSPKRKLEAGKMVEITAANYYNSDRTFKHYHKGYKTGVDFDKKDLPIDPYWLGLWLGDGNSNYPAITTGDKEIIDYIYNYANINGLSVGEQNGNGCKTYYLSKYKNRCATKKMNKEGDKTRANPLMFLLRKFNLINNKHIPIVYKSNDRQSRLKLLAGLIDSDGNFKRKGSLEFCNSNKQLAEDVCWLARSLGFRSSVNIKKTSIKSIGYKGTSHRVIISGKISDIPVLLKRKQSGDNTKYIALRYGIFVIPIEKGNYYGFEIDGDGKFLLGDFTVTHNTKIASQIIGKLKTSPFMFYVLTEDLMNQAYEELSETLNVPIGRIGGGEFDIKSINICTIQTAVRAINIENKSFKISDYKFDEEDAWDENQILDIDKSQQIKDLIKNTRGLVFDECHHASAKTVREVISASPFAYWKFGLSATPFREDGAEIMIQALFGQKIVDISASYLIDRGYLIEPYILFDSIKHDCKLHSYQSIYKECIASNNSFNGHVADIANHLVARGLSVLVLVQQYSQGEILKKLIPNTEFLTGKMNRKKRKQAIQDLKDRKTLCLISTNLADEGLDIPTLDAALLAGGGASSTRVHQRIGRTLRIDRTSKNPRDKSIVVYFQHEGVKHLDKHAKKAKKIIKMEPRFKIIDSGGQSFICNEIDEIMELGNNESKTTIDKI
jgi:superfamily II DNA or RNA helicase